MTCQFCGKVRCVHGSPEDGRYALAAPRKVAQAATPEEKPRSGDSLFELIGLRDLECVLCKWIAPPGRYQPVLRIQHGLVHVRDGTAVEIRRGLPEGAVRYEVA